MAFLFFPPNAIATLFMSSWHKFKVLKSLWSSWSLAYHPTTLVTAGKWVRVILLLCNAPNLNSTSNSTRAAFAFSWEKHKSEKYSSHIIRTWIGPLYFRQFISGYLTVLKSGIFPNLLKFPPDSPEAYKAMWMWYSQSQETGVACIWFQCIFTRGRLHALLVLCL